MKMTCKYIYYGMSPIYWPILLARYKMDRWIDSNLITFLFYNFINLLGDPYGKLRKCEVNYISILM